MDFVRNGEVAVAVGRVAWMAWSHLLLMLMFLTTSSCMSLVIAAVLDGLRRYGRRSSFCLTSMVGRCDENSLASFSVSVG